MALLSILKIVELILEITLQVMQDMPPEQRAAAWEAHAKRVAFWERLAERMFQREDAAKVPQ